MTQPQQPTSPTPSTSYDGGIMNLEMALDTARTQLRRGDIRQALHFAHAQREGWLLRDAQAKAEVAPLLAALHHVLPAIRWGMTHLPGNSNQWRDCEAEISAAIAQYEARTP